MMKKSLFAAAVFASLAAVSVGASAQGVTTYGVIDLAVGHTSTGASSNEALLQGVSSASRLGFKGGEMLDDGYKAFFQIEGGFRPDTGAQADGGKLYNRVSIVGLETAYGTVRLGRDFTPVYHAMIHSDALGEGYFGNNFNFGGSASADNGVFFSSPTFGGVTVSAHFGFGNETGALAASENVAASKKGGRTVAVGVDYVQGPIAAHAATLQAKADDGVAKTTQTLLGGSYNLGVGQLFATVYRQENEGVDKTEAFSGGIKAAVYKGHVMAQVARITNKVGAASMTSKNLAVAYTQPLAKHTSVYASYGRTTNDDGAMVGLSSGGDMVTPAAAGATAKGFAVGVKHAF